MKPELVMTEEAKAREVLPEAVVNFIESCCRKPRPESQLISVLHKVQEHFGYLSVEHMDAVSVLMRIPSAKVTGVASFYHYFNFTPRGKHRISVCLGTACFVKGAGRVLDRLREMLGIDVGQTTGDRLFSIDVARCVGACALAPVMIVDDKVHAEVKPDQVAGILAEYGFDAKKTAAKQAGAKSLN